MKEKVYINGYFRKNLGDDLFVKILLDRYPDTIFEMYSPFNYKKVLKNKNVKIYSKNSFINIYKKLLGEKNKLFKKNEIVSIDRIKKYSNNVFIGGSIFMEKDDMDLELYKKNRFNINSNICILGANFGPVLTDEYVKLHREDIFTKISDICFRDENSYSYFKDLDNVRYAPDIVFNLDTSKYKIEENNVAIISVININKDGQKYNQRLYNKKIVDLIKILNQKNLKIVLMSFSKDQGDEKVIKDILKDKELKKIDGIKKYFYNGNIDEALKIISSSKIVVGTRFHANILGLLFNKTVIPIAYSDKTINVFRDMHFEGKIFDIRKNETFDIESLNDDDLKYKHNVEELIIKSNLQFKYLDKILKKITK